MGATGGIATSITVGVLRWVRLVAIPPVLLAVRCNPADRAGAVDRELDEYPVSTKVNSPRNQGRELIAKVEDS